LAADLQDQEEDDEPTFGVIDRDRPGKVCYRASKFDRQMTSGTRLNIVGSSASERGGTRINREIPAVATLVTIAIGLLSAIRFEHRKLAAAKLQQHKD
jgi:hypothetical protein